MQDEFGDFEEPDNNDDLEYIYLWDEQFRIDKRFGEGEKLFNMYSISLDERMAIEQLLEQGDSFSDNQLKEILDHMNRQNEEQDEKQRLREIEYLDLLRQKQKMDDDDNKNKLYVEPGLGKHQ
ncbi:MAG: hypothetical protein EZS28_034249 [Streblomastix strix]|uniref:Uncharacterized protein n=1 Tax=Streblomastix strix TaxID=222440 RepID=A0A5J4UJ43_9EUKA|nr:MAG: hypothetical protein EZS28_034249 [Streblomastix strix]